MKKRFFVHFLTAVVVTSLVLTGVVATSLVFHFFGKEKPIIKESQIVFPVEDMRCLQQDNKIVFCESFRQDWP